MNVPRPRVAERVRRGGHHVPEEEVRRRYRRGLANFVEIYRPLADFWTLCDNSGSELAIAARGERAGIVEVIDRRLYEEIERAAHSG